MNTPRFSPQIRAHYDLGVEGDRLKHSTGKLEFHRTQELIARFLPPPPATVFDIGGATGVYAFPLASQGYRVHLVDPVPLQIDAAFTRSQNASHPLHGIVLGDARQLEAKDECADAVLLLGPLYHLTDREDRLQALREAHRILRPGGVILSAAISRFASNHDGLVRELFRDPAFLDIVEQDLATGVHENPTSNPHYFTTAYFHRPEEIRGELEEAGFENIGTIAVEGPAWFLKDFEERWADPERRTWLLDAIRRVESEPSLLGASAHLIGMGFRSSSRPTRERRAPDTP